MVLRALVTTAGGSPTNNPRRLLGRVDIAQGELRAVRPNTLDGYRVDQEHGAAV